MSNLENDIGFGYCGKVYDIGTGLYDYGFRDYSPVSARFTTVDPIRDGSNWFSYVVNDPVNYVDPFGLTASDRGSVPNFSGLVGQNIGFDGFTINTPFSNDQKSEFSPFGPYFTATTITGYSFDLSGEKNHNIPVHRPNIIMGITNDVQNGISSSSVENQKIYYDGEELKQILNGQSTAVANLGNIISRIEKYINDDRIIDDELYYSTLNYLNFNLNNRNEALTLISNLTAIRNNLAAMTQNQFKVGYRNFEYAGYVERIWDKEHNNYRYTEDIFINEGAFYSQYGMDEILIHEESHKVLRTEDKRYEKDELRKGIKRPLIDMAPDEKQINADNWRKFYQKVR